MLSPLATARRGVWPTRLLAIFLAFLALGFHETASAQNPSPCFDADFYRTRGELDLARGRYEQLQTDPYTAPCAELGLAQITRDIVRAQAIFEDGQKDEAAKDLKSALEKYQQALAIDRAHAGAAKALKSLGNDEGSKFAAAVALAKAGFYEEARIAMQKIIKETKESPTPAEMRIINSKFESAIVLAREGKREEAREEMTRIIRETRESPTEDEIKAINESKFDSAVRLAEAGLYDEARAQMKKVIEEEGMLPSEAERNKIDGKPDEWYALRDKFDDFWIAARDILIFGAVVTAVFIILWRAIPRAYRLTPIPDWLPNKEWLPTRRWKLDIQDFHKGNSGLEIGAQISALVEEHLRRFDSSQGRGRAALVTGVVESTPLPADLGTAAPQAKLIAGLIDFVFPQQQLILNGFLQCSETHGAGLTVALSDTRGKEISSNVTLWADEFGLDGKDSAKTSDHFFALAEVAAIWTRFRLEAMSA